MLNIKAFIQINDWEIKKFLLIITFIQFSVIAVILCDLFIINTYILRPLIVFIYLSYIPGIIILRVLKMHNLGNVKTMMFSAGLSILTVMLTGLILYATQQIIQLSNLISTIPLMIALLIINTVLCFLCYVRDADYCHPDFIEIDKPSIMAIFLCVVTLILAVSGAYVFNEFNLNILAIICIFSILLIILKSVSLPAKTYPLIIFIISLSLLLTFSLRGDYLVERGDNHFEYYIANQVVENSALDSSFYSNLNSALSIVYLAPIYSLLTGLNIVWVFKIVFPVLYSIMPVGLYYVYKKLTNEHIAIIATFVFLSMFTFYTTMLGLNRQQIAEIYIVLLMLLITASNLSAINRMILSILFGLGIIISHYSIADLLAIVFISSIIMVFAIELFNRNNFKSLKGLFKTKLVTRKYTLLNANFIIIFFVLNLIWMIFYNNYSFENVVYLFALVIKNFQAHLLDSNYAQGAGLILYNSLSFVGQFNKLMHITIQLLILTGIIYIIFNRKKIYLNTEYVMLSIQFFIICILSIFVPFFASTLNTSRIYHLSLIFIAPFCVIGGISAISGLTAKLNFNISSMQIYKVLSVIICIYLLSNTGTLYELTGQYGILSNDPHSIGFDNQETNAANWFLTNKNNTYDYYNDMNYAYLISMFDGYYKYGNFSSLDDSKESYVFLGKMNVLHGTLMEHVDKKTSDDYRLSFEYVAIKEQPTCDMIENLDLIYSNSYDRIYFNKIDKNSIE